MYYAQFTYALHGADGAVIERGRWVPGESGRWIDGYGFTPGQLQLQHSGRDVHFFGSDDEPQRASALYELACFLDEHAFLTDSFMDACNVEAAYQIRSDAYHITTGYHISGGCIERRIMMRLRGRSTWAMLDAELDDTELAACLALDMLELSPFGKLDESRMLDMEYLAIVWDYLLTQDESAARGLFVIIRSLDAAHGLAVTSAIGDSI